MSARDTPAMIRAIDALTSTFNRLKYVWPGDAFAASILDNPLLDAARQTSLRHAEQALTSRNYPAMVNALRDLNGHLTGGR